MSISSRKKYTREFRAEATRLVLEEKISQAMVARDLGISDSSISRWLRQARIDKGQSSDALTTAERQELLQLRRENRRLRMERDVLKKATAFFARDSLS